MVDYYEELCPYCENNLLLMYICDDCNAVFCGDCLKESIKDELICSNCGNGDLGLNKAEKFYCKSCHSENIVSIKKTVKICPGCGESHVTKISDKIKSLKQEFIKIITGTRQYLTPLNSKVDEINDLKARLLHLRQNSVKIYHFTQLELELLQLIKLFDNVKEAVKQKTVDFYDEVNRNMKYYCNISRVQPKILPIIGAISDSLKKNSQDHIKFVNDSVRRLEGRISQISIKINFMERIHGLFATDIDLLKFGENERAVFGLRCKLGEAEGKDLEYRSKNGTVLLTNKRLYFMHEKGKRKKTKVLLFSVLLEDLQTVQIEGTFNKKLTLEFVNSMYKFVIPKEQREQLKDFIEKARTQENSKLDEKSLETLKTVDVNLSQFKDTLEDAIYTITTYCNSPLEFETRPESRNSIERQHKDYKFYERHALTKQMMQNNQAINDNGINNQGNSGEQKKFPDYPNVNKWFGQENLDGNGVNPGLSSGDSQGLSQGLSPNMGSQNFPDEYQSNSYYQNNPNGNIAGYPYPVGPNYNGYYVPRYGENRSDRGLNYLYQTYQKRPIIPNDVIYNVEHSYPGGCGFKTVNQPIPNQQLNRMVPNYMGLNPQNFGIPYQGSPSLGQMQPQYQYDPYRSNSYPQRSYPQESYQKDPHGQRQRNPLKQSIQSVQSGMHNPPNQNRNYDGYSGQNSDNRGNQYQNQPYEEPTQYRYDGEQQNFKVDPRMGGSNKQRSYTQYRKHQSPYNDSRNQHESLKKTGDQVFGNVDLHNQFNQIRGMPSRENTFNSKDKFSKSISGESIDRKNSSVTGNSLRNQHMKNQLKRQAARGNNNDNINGGFHRDSYNRFSSKTNNRPSQPNELNSQVRSKQSQYPPNDVNGFNERPNPSVFNNLYDMFSTKEDFPPKFVKSEKKPEPFKIPKVSFGNLGKPKNFGEELMKLEEKQFALDRTIEMLDLRQKRGLIDDEQYLVQYQKLQGESYNIRKQIEKIKQNM